MIIWMARLDIDEIQFKDILKVLHKAIELLAEIKTNWNDLTIFFRNIAQDIDMTVTRKESSGWIQFNFVSFENVCWCFECLSRLMLLKIKEDRIKELKKLIDEKEVKQLIN